MARSGVKPVVEAGKAKRRARHSLKAGAGRGGRRGVLKTLQPHATDPKFLVGAGSPRSAAIKAGKKTEFFPSPPSMSPQSPPSPPLPSPHTPPPHSPPPHTPPHATNAEQTAQPTPMTSVETTAPAAHSLEYRMCTEDPPPVEYWQELAEQRRVALAQTLQENEQLHTELQSLKLKFPVVENELLYFSFMYHLSSYPTS